MLVGRLTTLRFGPCLDWRTSAKQGIDGGEDGSGLLQLKSEPESICLIVACAIEPKSLTRKPLRIHAEENAMSGRFRWVVVALLFLITIINYIDRSAIAFAIHEIEAEFQLSSASVGLILGAFGIGYILTTLIGGIVADRFGAKITLGVVAVVWSLSMGFMGLATGFVMLYAARIALGAAEGPSFPALNKAVHGWLPAQERGTALAGALVAVPLALAAGAPIVSSLIGWLGWRGMFVVLGVLVLIWLPLWLILFKDDPAASLHVSPKERDLIASAGAEGATTETAERKGWMVLLTTPTLLANYFAYFVFGYFLFFFMTWLPSYLRKSYGLDLSQVGLVAVLPWLTAAVALVIGGRISDRTLARTGNYRRSRTYQIALTQAVAALAVIPVALTGDVTIAVAGITVAVAAALAPNAAFYAVVVDVVPRYAATAMGVMTVWFAAAGFLAPVITGALLQFTGDFRYAFLLMAVLATLSVLGLLVFHRPDVDRKRLAGL
ncbi:MFS transporter [Acuticoccus sp. MNP-M23]|uniref:MFS transporter n=1 Tax=Acuticoccus sp. MNP-M23 TaxID=3072793 RepID=UPI0028161904|nr:MFS transporter [Acuticoccus sp. MNP-M23]WMS43923.1 MFS transporter [Acuticoccus sp. MNP-M23]